MIKKGLQWMLSGVESHLTRWRTHKIGHFFTILVYFSKNDKAGEEQGTLGHERY